MLAVFPFLIQLPFLDRHDDKCEDRDLELEECLTNEHQEDQLKFYHHDQ